MAGFDITKVMAEQSDYEFHPPFIESPDFSQLADLTGLKHEDDQLQLDLDTRQIGKQQQKVAIQQLREINYGSTDRYDFIFDIVHFCLEGLALAVCIILSIRLYKVHIVLATLNHSAQATRLIQPTVAPPPSTPPSTMSVLSLSNTAMLLFTIIIICTLLQLAKHALKRLLHKQLTTLCVTETSVYLVFTSIDHSYVHQLYTINECVKQIHLYAMPAVTDNYYHSTCFGSSDFLGTPC